MLGRGFIVDVAVNLRPMSTSRHGQADLQRIVDPEAVVRSEIAASPKRIAARSFEIGYGYPARHPATALRQEIDLAALDSSLRNTNIAKVDFPEHTMPSPCCFTVLEAAARDAARV